MESVYFSGTTVHQEEKADPRDGFFETVKNSHCAPARNNRRGGIFNTLKKADPKGSAF